MSGFEGDEILRLDLDPAERTVVEGLNRWLVENPNAEWKQSPRFGLVEQCSDRRLPEILMPLTKVCYFPDNLGEDLSLIIAGLSSCYFQGITIEVGP
jgi:hypothetical protein